MTRNTAILEINADLLKAALGLPPDTIIAAMREGSLADAGLGSILLRVEHPGLPEVAEGHPAPNVQALITRNERGRPQFVRWEPNSEGVLLIRKEERSFAEKMVAEELSLPSRRLQVRLAAGSWRDRPSLLQ